MALTRTVLTLGTVALALTVLHGDRGLLGPRPAAAPRPVSVAPVDSLPAPAAGQGGGRRHSPPVEITIPVIGLRSGLVRLDATPDGTLRRPTDPGTAGWYGSGPYPGDDNSPPALVVGQAGPGRAVFARLAELRPGNSVLVRDRDGRTAAFEVYRVARYPGPGLPTGRVYAPGPRAELRLVTWPAGQGGAGSGTGGVVVYAALRTPEVAPPSRTTPGVTEASPGGAPKDAPRDQPPTQNARDVTG